MTGENFNEHEQAESTTQRTHNLRVSYTFEFSNQLNKALHFVIGKIGFNPLEEFTFINGLNHIKLCDANGKSLAIYLDLHDQGTLESIVFHTDDCLRDYHKYIVSGVEFLSRPEYTSAGLQVKFIDEEDNCYTLLEERNYSESS